MSCSCGQGVKKRAKSAYCSNSTSKPVCPCSASVEEKTSSPACPCSTRNQDGKECPYAREQEDPEELREKEDRRREKEEAKRREQRERKEQRELQKERERQAQLEKQRQKNQLPKALIGTAKAGPIDIHVPVIWVLGGPGSGKGTQCDKIVTKYGFTHLSSGDLLRNEVASGSERGVELSKIMAKGELVPMQVVLDLLKEAMLKSLKKASKGFLIDGYPREKEQGVMFEKNISPVNLVLFFEASENTLVKRLLGRAETSGRLDDNEETIKNRLHTFNTHNDQVLSQYTSKLKRINAERDVEEIFDEVQTYINPLVTKVKISHK